VRAAEPWSGAYAENPEAVCSTTIHSFMTSTCSHEEPAIVVQQAKCIANLHLMKIGYRTAAAASNTMRRTGGVPLVAFITPASVIAQILTHLRTRAAARHAPSVHGAVTQP